MPARHRGSRDRGRRTPGDLRGEHVVSSRFRSQLVDQLLRDRFAPGLFALDGQHDLVDELADAPGDFGRPFRVVELHALSLWDYRHIVWDYHGQNGNLTGSGAETAVASASPGSSSLLSKPV